MEFFQIKIYGELNTSDTSYGRITVSKLPDLFQSVPNSRPQLLYPHYTTNTKPTKHNKPHHIVYVINLRRPFKLDTEIWLR